MHPAVELAPGIQLFDGSASELVDLLSDLALSPDGTPAVAFAAHVSALAALKDPSFAHALSAARINYADGISIVLLARLAGGLAIERAATTDIGLPTLKRSAEKLGRPARVALVGGPQGLADRASEEIRHSTGAEVVLATHGYHADWDAVLDALSMAAPDIVLVGLGCPAEQKWVHQHYARLPPCLVLTVGGWFGFLTGTERRSPAVMQRLGIEWLYRLYRDPKRLIQRYTMGIAEFLHRAAKIIANR